MVCATLLMNHALRQNLRSLAGLFLRLGFTAFGGPAAHIAMMHDETVERRGWLSDQAFLDLVGATNLIPGPNSTEMAIHLGYLRAGWPGLIVSGVCFILPAAGMVLALAWAYAQYGTLPQAAGLLYGIKPVVMAVIAQALWTLGRSAVKSALLAGIGLAVLAGYFLGANEIGLLAAGGVTAMLARNLHRLRGGVSWRGLLPGLPFAKTVFAPSVAASAPTVAGLFLNFLKIGSVLYGSGYVLLAFLRADFVARLGWLTDQQLLDAVAIGQVTPGPVFTTATFIGYLLGGTSGALAATVGIFLPSFLFVGLTNPLIPRLRASAWVSGLLDGVNVASLGLMAAVAWQLGRSSLVDPLTAVLALLALGLLVRYRVNTTWLIAGGGLIGLLSAALQ